MSTAVQEQFLLKGSLSSQARRLATAKTIPFIKYGYHSIWYFLMKKPSLSAIQWGTLGTSCVVPTGKWYHTETIKHRFHLLVIRRLAFPPPCHHETSWWLSTVRAVPDIREVGEDTLVPEWSNGSILITPCKVLSQKVRCREAHAISCWTTRIVRKDSSQTKVE